MKRKPAKKRPPKDPNALDKIRQAIESGEYAELNVHARSRQAERQITRPEYEYVLKNGHHEKSKDEFKEEFQAWNYAIRGTTVDGRELRVAVSFDCDGKLLIVTLIDLSQS